MNITPTSRFSWPVGAFFVGVVVLVVTTWRAANAFNDLKKEMADMRRDLTTVTTERWSTSDMERWAYRLERSNREKLLIVPDVRGIREERSLP